MHIAHLKAWKDLNKQAMRTSIHNFLGSFDFLVEILRSVYSIQSGSEMSCAVWKLLYFAIGIFSVWTKV